MDTLYEKLLQASFRFVSFRLRSEKEIRDFLRKKLKTWKTVGDYSIEKVITRLKDYGYVDDAKFAAWWVDQRSTFRPKGKRLIVLELQRHGISRATAEDAFESKKGVLGPYSELESAQKSVARKLAGWARLPQMERRQKVSAFLGRRGFSSGTIAAIIDEVGEKRYNTHEEKDSI